VIDTLRYLTWGLLSIAPAFLVGFFIPRPLPLLVTIPLMLVMFVWTVAAMLLSALFWQALCKAFGWKLPVEDNEDDEEISN
jgi:hypothetical protein